MSASAKRDWTQYDIVDATRAIHSGPGFFRVLGDVCESAFGGALDYDIGQWQFPMNDLTIGDIADFFGEHNARPMVRWHNEFGGPTAYIEISGDALANAFQARFGINPLDSEEAQRLSDEDTFRAGW